MLTAGREFDGCCADKGWRVMILRSSGNIDDDSFSVAADVNPVDFALPSSGEAVESGANGDGHGAGTADACPRGRFGIRGEREAALRMDELGDFREEREAAALSFHEGGEGGETFFSLDVAGNQLDALVPAGMRFDGARSVQRNRGVKCDRARMNGIEEPNVERAAGEVHAGRCFGFDDHECESARFRGFSAESV